MTEHTTLPLALKKCGDSYNLLGGDDKVIMTLTGLWFPSTRQIEMFEDIARLIVTACNCHADLLEALKVALASVEWMADATDADPEDHERLAVVTKAIRRAEE